MKRREIIEEGKQFLLWHGPARVCEFGEELFDNNTAVDSPLRPYKRQIIDEAVKQAKRVYDFLGYDSPWH